MPKTYLKTCYDCKATFTALGATAQYCSRRCFDRQRRRVFKETYGFDRSRVLRDTRELNGQCRGCGNPTDRKGKLCRFCLGKGQRVRDIAKSKVFNAYGNICICCGEQRGEFLTIDHIYNDGAQHRKQLSGNGSGYSLHIFLIRNNYPKDRFRILCYNCNCSRGRHGYCPHEKERTQATAA